MRLFASGFFHESVSFPQPQRVSHEDRFDFFRNSRRYSQVKVHHRYQQHRCQVKSKISRHCPFNSYLVQLTLVEVGRAPGCVVPVPAHDVVQALQLLLQAARVAVFHIWPKEKACHNFFSRQFL
jgi:hypothetical protein